MPGWLILVCTLVGLSLVVPLFVLGNTAGNWRAALRAWKQYGLLMACLMAPAFITGMCTSVMR